MTTKALLQLTFLQNSKINFYNNNQLKIVFEKHRTKKKRQITRKKQKKTKKQ